MKMVDLNSFNSVLGYFHTSGYVLLFLVMILGGSAVTTVAAFAASLGYFNIFLIALLSFTSDLFESALFYTLGYFGRRKLIGDYGSFFGIKVKALYKLETHFQNHFLKTLFFVKMTPFLGIPGLTLAGVSHVPLKKYITWNVVISFLKSVLFSAIGFFLGFVAKSFLEDKPLGIYFFILIILMVLLSWVAKRFMEKMLKKEFSLGQVEIYSHKFYGFFSEFFYSFKKLKNKIKLNFVNKFFN